MPKVCPVCGTSYPDPNVFCPSDGSTLRAAEADGDLIGSVVADRYLVTDLLGEGGMGKVYLARHVRLPLQAAIKVLRPELLKDAASVARFNREAANASRIEHASVARVFDFGETSDGTVYLAMEFIAGRPLKDVLEADGPLTAARTAVIVRQVADGLDAAHRLGIVHRDLKPDNIMVTVDDDGTDRCKVVDFGIAKAIGSNEKEAGLTRTGFVVGTPEFMSPEQLLGTELDHRSDVYALGLVAYTCLTLDLPFDRNTPDRGMTARLMSTPRPLSVVRPDMSWPAALQAALDQALEREPGNRTASAGAFAKALEAALSPSGAAPATAALSAPVAPPVAAPAPAATAPVAAATAPAVVPPPAVANTPARKSGKSAAIDQPPPRRRTISWPRVRLPSLGFILFVGGAWWFVTKQRAPRPSDVNQLVRNATQTANAVVDGAQSAAASAQRAIESAQSDAPATDAPATDAPATDAPASTRTAERPTSGATGTKAATPASAAVPVAPPSPSRSATGRRTLDSIAKALDPLTATEADAGAAIPVLRNLISGLSSDEDRAWAYIRIAEAHLLMDEVKPACNALRTARGLAQSMTQADVITNYTGKLSCAP
jgi:serine/threonine-protein kinase